MINPIENSRISFEIENTRIYVSFDDGFFNLDKTNSSFHNHNRYEFHLALEGTTYIETESRRFTMKKWEGYLIAPGLIHTCLLQEKAAVKSSFWFRFERIKKETERDVYSLFVKAFNNIDGIKKINHAKKYIDGLKQIISEFYSQNLLATDKIKSGFALLMMQLVEELLPESKQDMDARQYNGTMASEERNLRRIMIEEYINRNYNKNISLEHLANVLHLSKKQASRVFLSEFGTNFKTYITKFRINISMHFLRQTDLPVVKISSLVGYKSYTGFYKAFLTYTKETPENYRQQHIE